jgi:hypothetical protein
MTTKNFNVKNGLTTGNILLDAGTGNVTAYGANIGGVLIGGASDTITGNGALLTNLNGANVTGQVGNALLAGTVYTNAQPNITSVGTLSSLSVTANITAGNIAGGNLVSASYISGDGSLLSSLTGGNVTGQVGNALVAGTVYTNAQPNITSVGTLSSLNVTNSVTAGNIKTNNLLYSNGTAWSFMTVAGSDTQVQFNDGSAFGASSGLTFNKTTGLLSITGNVSAGNISATLVGGTLTTAAQPNITSVGTLGSLTVSGVITATAGGVKVGNIQDPSGTNTITLASGAVSMIGNLTIGTAGTGNLTASNANLGNLVVANYFTGTLTTNAQPNITSVGTLTSLSVTGNVSAGNLIGTFANGDSNVKFSGASGNLVINANAGVTNKPWTFSTDGNLYTPESGQIRAGSSFYGITVSDYSNNSYIAMDAVDTIIQGNSFVRIQTNGGSEFNFNPGNLVTGNANVVVGTGNVDAGNVTVAGQINASSTTNATGLGTGAITTPGGASVSKDLYVGGTIYAPNYAYVNSTTLSATAALLYLTAEPSYPYNYDIGFYSHFATGSGGVGYQHTGFVRDNGDNAWYLFSNAAEPTGGQVDLANANLVFDTLKLGSFVAHGDGNITGNLLVGNISGANLITSNYFSGSGNLLSNIQGGNVSGAVAYATTANAVAGANVSGAVAFATTANAVAGANVSGAVTFATTANSVAGGNVSGQVSNALVAGTVYTGAQPNITSVGTLSSLDVTANISAGNISGGNLVSATYISGNGSLLSSITGANVSGEVASANIAWRVSSASQPNITSVGRLTSLVVGNASSNVTITDSNGNGFITTTGNITAPYFIGNVIGNISGTIAVTGNDTAVLYNDHGNVGASDGFKFNYSANILTLTGNIITNNANLGNAVTANYFIGNGSLLTGVAASSATTATTAGTVTTAAQPNITSVGTLTTLDVSGNISAGNISGGNLVSATYISGNGSLLTSITGANVTGTVANATYSTSAGSATTAGTVTTAAQPNITSVGTLTSLAVSGDATAGNVKVDGGILSNRANVTVSASATAIDQFSPSTHRSAKYVITATGAGSDGYQVAEVLLVHDGASSFITIYGSLCSNATVDIVEFSSNINGLTGNTTLYATSANGTASVNLVTIYG